MANDIEALQKQNLKKFHNRRTHKFSHGFVSFFWIFEPLVSYFKSRQLFDRAVVMPAVLALRDLLAELVDLLVQVFFP